MLQEDLITSALLIASEEGNLAGLDELTAIHRVNLNAANQVGPQCCRLFFRRFLPSLLPTRRRRRSDFTRLDFLIYPRCVMYSEHRIFNSLHSSRIAVILGRLLTRRKETVTCPPVHHGCDPSSALGLG